MTNDWRNTAACKGRYDLMDLTRTRGPVTGADLATELRAAAICSRCPHTGRDGPCLAEFLDFDQAIRDNNAMMIAGYTPEQLKRIDRLSRGGRKRPPSPTRDAILCEIAHHPLTIGEISELIGRSAKSVKSSIDIARPAGYVRMAGRAQPRGVGQPRRLWAATPKGRALIGLAAGDGEVAS